MKHHQTGKTQTVFGFIFLGLAVLGLIIGTAHYKSSLTKWTEASLDIAEYYRNETNPGQGTPEQAEMTRNVVQTLIDGSYLFKLTMPIYILLDILLFAVAVLMISQDYANKHLANAQKATKDQK